MLFELASSNSKDSAPRASYIGTSRQDKSALIKPICIHKNLPSCSTKREAGYKAPIGLAVLLSPNRDLEGLEAKKRLDFGVEGPEASNV